MVIVTNAKPSKVKGVVESKPARCRSTRTIIIREDGKPIDSTSAKRNGVFRIPNAGLAPMTKYSAAVPRNVFKSKKGRLVCRPDKVPFFTSAG